MPDDAEISVHREWLLVKLRTPWTVCGKAYAEGSLLAARFDDFMAGKRELTLLFNPTATASLADYSWTRHHLILNVLDDVKNRPLCAHAGSRSLEVRVVVTLPVLKTGCNKSAARMCK